MSGASPPHRAPANIALAMPIKVGGSQVTAKVKAPASRARLSFTLPKATTVAARFLSWTFPADGATSTYLADRSGKKIRGLRVLDGTGPWSARPVRLRPGSYFVVVDTGRSADSGSVTVQLSAVGTVAVNGRPHAARIGKTQQPDLLAFTAKAGAMVVAGASGAVFNAGHGATLGIENGDGVAQGPVTFAGGTIDPVFAVARLHATGVYYVVFRPAGPGTAGSAKLTLRIVPPQARAVIGGPAVTVRTKAPGVPALASFTAKAKESIAVLVRSTTFAGHVARFYVTGKKGIPIGPEQYLAKSKAVDGPVDLPSAGRYSVVIDPGQGGSAGSVRFSLVKVTDVRLRTSVGGRAVTAVIRRPAQRAVITFPAKANQQVRVKFSASTFGSSADTLALDGPGNAQIEAPVPLNKPSGQLSAAKLPKSGSYAVLIDPSFTGDTGKVTVKVSRASGVAEASSAIRQPATRSPGTDAAVPLGPVFNVSYNVTETDLVTDGQPGGLYQGVDNTSTIRANWFQLPDGSVSGQAAEQSSGHTWLYNDVCIIARLSDSSSSGQFSGPLLSGEAGISAGPKGKASYVIVPDTMFINGTQTTQHLEYDTPECSSGESVSTETFRTTVFPGKITGSIPAGHTFTTGHSSCGSGVTIRNSISTSVTVISCSLDWSLTAPPAITCQATKVTLPAADAPVTLAAKPFRISYGDLPLTFTSVPTSKDSLCTIRSNDGALPVFVIAPTLPREQVASSVTQATLDFFPADDPSTRVPMCKFAGLRSLGDADVTPPPKDFKGTTNCLLTSSSHAGGDVIVRWSIPGFTEYAPDRRFGVRLDTTSPLTYYADLSALPNPPGSGASFQDVVQSAESYIHLTLIRNLPMIDKIGMIQDPPAHLLITDPLGRAVGRRGHGKVVTFPGAGYAEAGGRSIAWILEPVPGAYRVTASGPAGTHFHSDFTILQFLGHGTAPLKKNTHRNGTIGPNGTAKASYSIHGDSLAPVLRPHESRRRVKRRAPVRFSLAGSVIPFAPAKAVWSFGDGAKAKGVAVTHRFKKAGKHVVVVTVTNSRGIKVTATLPPIVVTR